MSERKPIPAEQCPVLGREYNHFDGPLLNNPFPFFKRLRNEARITLYPTLGMWLVSHYDDIASVLEDHRTFSSVGSVEQGENLTPEAREILGPEPLLPSTPLNEDPPTHTRMRRFLQPGFSPARIARQEPTVRQHANALIDGFIHAGQADLVEQFTHPFCLRGLLDLMGVPQEDGERVKRWTGDLFSLCFGMAPAEAQPALARGVSEFRAFCAQLIEQRKREPREDMVSSLVHSEPQGQPLTAGEFLSLIVSLVAGGHEAPTAQLALIVKHLLEQPERWQKLREDPALIPRFIEEGMRLEGVVAGLTRTVTRDVELGGVLLPKGARLLLLCGSAHHDESKFKEPERFDPNRDNLQHFTLSRGVHFCAGASFGRLEMRIGLELLLERIPEMSLVPDQDYGYHQELVTLRSLRHLRVKWPVR